MSQSSAPWDGITTGSSGPYSSADWSEIWKYMVGAGASHANVGPMLGSGTNPNNGLKVQAQSPASTSVDVLQGSALIAGRFYLSDATVALAIAANASGNPRIDTIILRADYGLQTVVLAVLQGTAAASPTPPALTQTIGTLYEIPLADIAVANGFTSIADTNITPRHEWANASLGNFMLVLNNSGGTLSDGQVVVWDTTTDRAVTTTTTYNHAYPAGIVRGRISNGGYGLIQTHGVGLVVVDGTYSRGTGLFPSTTTAGRAGSLASGWAIGTIGTLLEASTGAAQLKLCAIAIRRSRVSIAKYSYTLAANSAGPSYTSGSDNTVALNTEDFDPDGIGTLSSNQVTVLPGLYHIEGRVDHTNATARGVRVILYNVTAAANALQGLNNFESVSGVIESVVSGPVSVTVATTFELRVRVSAATSSITALNLNSLSEIYNSLQFIRYNE